MKSKILISLVVLALLIGCAAKPETTTQEQTQPAQPEAEETPTETVETPAEQPAEQPTEIVKIPNDIKEILERGKIRLSSYSYNYKSPESDREYKLYVKGTSIKIILPERNTEEQGKFYNTIYLNKEEKTAQAYCIGYSDCEGKIGKIKDLNYEDTYVETPSDWLEKITEAVKIDERQVEGRDSVYLETNIGKITVESYYGFLYKIEDGKKKWEFTDAVFNSVKDSDVTPS